MKIQILPPWRASPPPPTLVTALQALLWGKCPRASPCPWPRGSCMGPSEPLSAPPCRCESVKSSSGTPGSSPLPSPRSPWTPLPGRSGWSIGSAGECRRPRDVYKRAPLVGGRLLHGGSWCVLAFGEETVTQQVGDKVCGDVLDFAVSALVGLRTRTPRLRLRGRRGVTWGNMGSGGRPWTRRLGETPAQAPRCHW